MAQNVFDPIEGIGRARMSKGDRLIAVSAARGVVPAVELLSRIGSMIRSACAFVEPSLFLPGSTDL